MAARTVVTISRQLGCGGAEVGQLVAAKLGYHYADREILHMAAQALEVKDEDISWREEKPANFWERIAELFPYGLPDAPYTAPPIRPVPDEQLFALEARVIRELAGREDCVVVGRGGAYVLRDHPRATHVMLHAPARFRSRRIMQVYNAPTRERAVGMIRESDHDRRAYLERMGHCDWLCAANYHLALDTSTIPLSLVADLIVKYVQLRCGS